MAASAASFIPAAAGGKNRAIARLKGESLTLSSSTLLIASFGAVFTILAIYVTMFASERKAYLMLWFIGWAIIAMNYAVDAFSPVLLRANRPAFLISTGSYFFANLLIVDGIYRFLEIKVNRRLWIGAASAWLLGFGAISVFWSDYASVVYVDAALFLMALQVGIVMIRVGRKRDRIALFLGILNIVWVFSAICFTYVLRTDQIFAYVLMHSMRFINAVGLIQMSFSTQKGKIQRGLEHIQCLSEHDQLTGLYNKSFFDAKIREYDQADDCLPVSLLVGDMNGLKFVNDVFGHREGDQWIRKAALLLSQACRREDIVARWGGDEFAVILLGADRDMASAIRDRIMRACAAQQDGEIPVSISIGLATKTDGETSLSDALRAAEKSMYEVKLVEGKKAKCAIIRSIDARMRDKGYETKEHLEGLERLAEEFAEALNLEEDRRADLKMAVKYCDIGKIGLPEEAVRQESSLDEHEWTVLKRHVEIGYRILGALGVRSPVADAVLCQHEWWNGQGFPQRLKEEKIPELSRILSIVRFYDAMAGRHPDAASCGERAKALEALRRQAGTRFDPDLTAQFISMMDGGTMTGVEAELEASLG